MAVWGTVAKYISILPPYTTRGGLLNPQLVNPCARSALISLLFLQVVTEKLNSPYPCQDILRRPAVVDGRYSCSMDVCLPMVTAWSGVGGGVV
jgi:hypothetical protein